MLNMNASWPSIFEPLQQGSDHLLNFKKFIFRFFVLARVQHLQVLCEEQEVLKFAGRAHGDVEKLTKFDASSASAAFCNVCRDRRSRTANLAAESKAFIRGERARQFICTKSQYVAPAPNLKSSEVLHSSLAPYSYSLPGNYLQLKTNNCQLVSEVHHAG